uniref:Zinc transporter ZIP11 n=1 Tax=Malurus cyaneus samueli TaxID=2593467 RepID=A0A8C5UAJ1_9PASS
MIAGYGPVLQALLGTFLTWGLTAAGSALVFVFSSGQVTLPFWPQVMLAASYWSLLAPAIEMAEESGTFGAFSFFPVAAGFALGAAFVYGADTCSPSVSVGNWETGHYLLMKPYQPHSPRSRPALLSCRRSSHCLPVGSAGLGLDKAENGEPYQRRRGAGTPLADGTPAFPVFPTFPAPRDGAPAAGSSSWRRIMLMILAITIHNVPEGLAVGVGFGAIGKSASATFQSARNLAIGIGIQNFPEGLAVSLPLRGAGFSTWKAFWYGQLSGMVEPLAGLWGAFAVVLAEPLLPYALGFAAGAMVYVVMDDIIPEAQTSGNGKLASWTSILGFVVMMSLDVGLG